MSHYAETLDRFLAAILQAEPGLAARDLTPGGQWRVYADGYRLRLGGALRAEYPALLSFLGEAGFEAVAQSYIEHTPSRHYNLDRYGFGFGEHVAARMPGFAGDLARLESAIAQVFMDPDSDALSPAALAGIDGEGLAALVLRPRLAARLVTFSTPADDWLAARRRGEAAPPPPAGPQHIYLYRHRNEVRRVVLSEAAFDFLRALCAGQTLGAAAEHTLARDPRADILSWLSDWIAAGFFRA